MKKQIIQGCLLTAFVTIVSLSNMAQSATVAYWRFEEGPANGPVLKPFGALDSSGNGYDLDPWSAGGWAGFVYRGDVAGSSVNGLANYFSIKNDGEYPGMVTDSADGIRTITPDAFTIEATFKLENGNHRTIIGRESRGSATINAELAALYFQAMPDNRLAIKFCDVSGFWHEAISATNVFTSFDYSSNPEGLDVPWYSMASVSNGSTLSLYLREVTAGSDWQLIAQTDMTLSGSPNTTLTMGTGDGSDWDAGNWSVGRGLYDGGHGDRAYGFIDEVRISDSALNTTEFLFSLLAPAGVIINPSAITVNEEGPTFADINIALQYAPDGDVQIILEDASFVDQVTLDKSVLTFTPANWNILQTVRVTAIDDTLLENATHTASLKLDFSSSVIAYNRLPAEIIEVTILENDCGAWGYAPGDMDKNCIVNIDDLVRFAQWWLDCSLPNQPGCTDFQ